ncbi:MAG: phosphate acyltransferase PlsX [Candidatus Hydrogenedentes bacterium]|nr:phosphate acyltransferase PlsX [Candidatus Hydrogenedentota bacterium]
MRIAIDAMGSDNAPGVEIEGAVRASLESDMEVILVGDEAALSEKLKAFPKHGSISIVHASEVITMEDSPVLAVRKKKDSSLLVAMRLVKEGRADGIVSAGNTGAVMVAARTVLGPIRGVARSAICQTLPTLKGPVAILDLGANVDCTARHLCEFAEMGIAYSQYTLGVDNPRVGLLNIGEEDAKGTQVAKEVHRNLRAAPHVNFIGNVEPRAMYNGVADVVICDGFIGNLILKTSEAVAGLMAQLMRQKFESSSASKLGAVLARKALTELKKIVDPNESPGAPLLGVNGTVIIIHGSSNSSGVAHAVLGARVAIANRLNEHIAENIEELRAVERTVHEGSHPECAPPEEGAQEALHDRAESGEGGE